MKKLTFTLFIALAVACLFSVPCNAKGKAKHVVFIGLDGWGSYSVPKADIPHIKQLMADGSYTLEKRTVLPSSSAVNWASMFMGAGPELHGYTQWGSKTPELPSRVLNQHGIFPTIFIVTANHGDIENGHGDKTMQEMQAPERTLRKEANSTKA